MFLNQERRANLTGCRLLIIFYILAVWPFQ